MDSQLGLVDNLAWAAALGKLLVVVPDSSQAADQAVVWAGLMQGRLGILGKLAFLMVDIQLEDTLHKRAVVLMEVAQSHLEGLEGSPQALKETCLVVRLSLQRSLPGWMPAVTANKARDRKVYKRLSFNNTLNTIQPP